MTLEDLERIVRSRASADPTESWTAKLVSRGPAKIAQKVGEEAVETVIAALDGGDDLADEAADLLYHLVVLLHAKGVSVADVMAVLESRQGQTGIVEKRSRGDG